LAKQLGVSEEAITGLQDPDHFPFPADQAAALRFADAMTRGSGEAPEAIFAELRRRFDEAQVVEIATVIGLFNYFNRFNNALQVPITLSDPSLVVDRVRRAIAAARDTRTAREEVATVLQRDRRYLRVALYGKEGERLVCRLHRGPRPIPTVETGDPGPVAVAARTAKPRAGDTRPAAAGGGADLPGAPSELAVPVVEGGTVAGIILVEGGTGPPDQEDIDLLQRVAVLLAPLIAGTPRPPAGPATA
jgi:GAF domain